MRGVGGGGRGQLLLSYRFIKLDSLQGLQQIFCENQPSLFLVSHGAECVMLNKKFYKDHVDANMTQRLKQQVSYDLIYYLDFFER